MLKTIHKITDTVERAQIALGCTTFMIFVTAVICQVASRFFKIPMVWTEDLANYSFIWSVYMGASVIFNRNQHFKFNVIEMKMKGKWHEIYTIIINLAVFIFCAIVFCYGIQLVQNFWGYKWNSIPQLRMGYHWICVPIMGLTMSVYAVGHIAEAVGNLKNKTFHNFDLLQSIEETEHINLEGGDVQ